MNGHRRGVALIIAISVLAALLFLALPFVFSQSASVAGARASAWDGAARRGSDRSAGLATAMAVFATGLHRTPQFGFALQSYVQLPLQINDAGGPIHYPSFIDNSWRLVLDSASDWTVISGTLSGLDHRDTLHGAVIEDESRRLDPNVLGERGWAIVLDRAHVADPPTVTWSWSGGNTSLPAGDPLHYGSWVVLLYGRLANRLADFRPANSHRYNRLEDLLGADPDEQVNDPPSPWTLGCEHVYPQGHDKTTGAATWPVALGATWSAARQTIELTRNPNEGADGYRVAPLTQAELELLRPFLSFLIPGQGRSGLIDVGTVVLAAPSSGDWNGLTTDELSPATMGVGLGLRPHDSARIRSQSNPGGRYLDNGWAVNGDALAIDAPPALNINTVPGASAMVRLFSSATPSGTPATIPGWPADPVLTPVTSIGKIGRLLWLDGRTGDGDADPNKWFERPAVGILGYGIVAIEGAATARDREGGAVAQRRHRTVVQAVPQERPFEAVWRTQGELEALVHARHGSWVMAGPHPTNRIKDWGATAGDMAALDCAGWLEPAPLCSFTRSTAVDFDWRVPFGLTKAQTWDDALRPVDANGNVDASVTPAVQPGQVKPNGLEVGALTAQGLRLRNGDGLAYECTNAAGPLRFNGGAIEEMRSRHVSLRFCLPAIAGTTTLVEMRNQADPVLFDHRVSPPVADPAAGTDAASATSLWRVEYRPADQVLVLVIANAALPWSAAQRQLYGIDAWKTGTDSDPSADVDPRTQSTGLDFAPVDPISTVEYRYKVAGGLAEGHWYHLQVFCASDRPGLHGLTLDGIVGRDATRPGVNMQQTGDHYTFPSLRLVGAMTPSAPATASNPAAELSKPASSITVTYPVDRSLDEILPVRGLIRIDDEYFSYTDRSGSGGTGTITGLQRARRQNTNQLSSEDANGNGKLDSPEDLNGNGLLDPGEDANANGRLDSAEDIDLDGVLDTVDDFRRWPITQHHNDGALVVPGWSQTRLTSGRWLRGDVTLADPAGLPTTPFATGTAAVTQLPGPDINNEYDFLPPATLSFIPVGTWSPRGMVRIDTTLGAARAYYVLAGTTLTLTWTGAGTVPRTGKLAANAVINLRQVSIEVNGQVDDIAGVGQRFAPGFDAISAPFPRPEEPALQIIDAITGECEWIRYQLRVSRGAEGNFFVHDAAWPLPASPPVPSSQTRSAMRTPFRAWLQGARVLPVQTSLGQTDRFEAGDVATVVADQVAAAAGPPATARRDPVQIVVRYAARDGFPTDRSKSGSNYDTKNEWFALAHAVPDALSDPGTAPQTVLVGRGWSGDDLSVVGNTPERRGVLPRRVFMELVPGGPARTFLGGPDTARNAGVAQDVIIDDLCAGALPGPADANSKASGAVPGGCEIVQIAGSATGGIGSLGSDLPVTVTASQPVFQRTHNQVYGLCLIDGEAFAYRWIDDASALLIGRALLGTAAAAHALTPNPAALVPTADGQPPSREVRPTLPVVRLPLGPIGELCTALSVGDHGKALDVVDIPFADYYRDPPASGFSNSYQDVYASVSQQHLDDEAPFLVISDPAGAAANPPEVLRLLDYPTQANQRIPTRWLRGLYGTSAQTWTPGFPNPATRPATWQNQDITPFVPVLATQTAGNLNPIVMAWWPRFAPGLPSSLPTTPAEAPAAVLRSRSFAWAGFPLRLHGMRLDPNIPGLSAVNGGLCDIKIAATGDCAVEARALAAGDGASELFDWDHSPVAALGLNANNLSGTPFSGWSPARFVAREVDGAEVRVHWTYGPGPGLSGLAAASAMQGSIPRIGATDDEAKAAPADTVGIHLRCMAPTRVLAVEEVR